MAEEERNEPEFKVTDKRRFKPENLHEIIADHEAGGSAEKTTSEEDSPSEKEQEEAQESASQEETGEAPDVYALLQWMIGLLHQQAWQAMGLVPSLATGKIERDLSQARVAIDCVAFMVNQVMPNASPAMQRELRSLLSDLQLNFITQSQRG